MLDLKRIFKVWIIAVLLCAFLISCSKDDDIFENPITEEFPRFPGCEDLDGTIEDRYDCASQEMLRYIYTNLRYPEAAREVCAEGICVIQFIVTKTGDINEATIIEDIGFGCGQASLEVVESMNDLDERWIPGKNNGEKIDVLYSLPVRFKKEV